MNEVSGQTNVFPGTRARFPLNFPMKHVDQGKKRGTEDNGGPGSSGGRDGRRRCSSRGGGGGDGAGGDGVGACTFRKKKNTFAQRTEGSLPTNAGVRTLCA